MYVNKYWITDNQRLNYMDFVNLNRIIEPSIKNGSVHENVSWEKAFSFAAIELTQFKPNEIMILGSPKAANEANYLLAKFAKEVVKTPNIDFLNYFDDSKQENEFESKDCAPNAAGAKEVGVIPGEKGMRAFDLADNINSGKIKALIVMEEFFEYHPDIIPLLENLDFLAVIAYNHSDLSKMADVTFPASTYAELEGTYTNRNKRVQHLTPALVTKENRRIMGMKMSRLDKFGSFNDRWSNHEERNSRQSWRIIQGIANEMGAKWSLSSEAVFDDIAENITAFKDMSYEKIDEYQGLILFKGNSPDPKIINYQSHYYKADMLQNTYGKHHQKALNKHV
jgi:predicted molibdopterin-dependent oxidoreductase YjgC